MSYKLRAFALFILLAPPLACGIAADFSDARRDQVLVMRNGQILRGRVTRVGDYYLVTMSRDNEVRMPAEQVEFACDSLEQAYLVKRNATSPFRAGEQVELAEWCLRHDLRQQAADHLLHAIGIDPGNKQVEALQVRWQSTLQLQRPVPRPKNTASNATHHVRKPAAQKLPDGAVEQFATKIQPLLMNSCGASTCHGAHAKSDFKLVRPLSRRPMTRRLTERNLESVLELVDHQSPGESRLLTTPQGPHADLSKGIFDSLESRQYQQLAAWVQRVAQPVPVLKPETEVQQAAFVASGENTETAPDGQPPAANEVVGPHSATTLAAKREPQLLDQDPKRSRAAPGGPRDPFDPEIFNRRFFGPR